MQCPSCGRSVPAERGPGCGCSPVARGEREAGSPQGGTLLADGGREEDRSSADEADDEETYLSPDEIVADDIAPDPRDESDSQHDDAEDATEPAPVSETDSETPPPSDERERSGKDERGQPDHTSTGDVTDEDEAAGTPGAGTDDAGDATGERAGTATPVERSEQESTPAEQSASAATAAGTTDGDGAGVGYTGGGAGVGYAGGATDAGHTGGGYADGVGDETLLDRLREFPLQLGATLGAVGLLFPYLVVTVATLFAYDESPPADPGMGAFDVAAEVFLTVASLGAGERIVELFVGSAGVGTPGEVDPSNYPTVEGQLGPLLELFETAPEVPLLLLYVAGPYVLFVSGRYLARHYAPRETDLDRVLAATTVTLGAFPLVLVLGLAFDVSALAERLLVAGLVVPAGVGALGGLSICAFDHRPAVVSALFGWAAVAVGVVLAALFVPLLAFDLPDGVALELSLLDQLALGLGAYLNAAAFAAPGGLVGWLLVALVALVTVCAGFLRSWRAGAFESRLQTSLVGASIWLGFLPAAVLLSWLFPVSTILVDISVAGDGTTLVAGVDAAALSGLEEGRVETATIRAVGGVAGYLQALALAGFAFPAIFGGVGGYLAALAREQQS